jgi:hypothetical protein
LNFQDLDFKTYLLWDDMPKIQVETAYRLPGNCLEAKQYLDYLLVETKGLDLAVLKDSLENPKKLRIYSNSYKRSFPNKFFKRFKMGSHTYFFGKYSDLDVYILFEPNDLENGCACAEIDTFVTDTVATIFQNEVLLGALSKYVYFIRIPNDILSGRNISISEQYENFSDYGYTEFYLNDFNDAFYHHLGFRDFRRVLQVWA